MLTTQALIDAALARGLREKLPKEWFDERYSCPACHSLFKILVSGTNCPNCCIRGQHEGDFPKFYKYIGPDLTAPANLYELMRLADAVFDNPPNVSWRGTSKGIDTFAVLGRVDGNFIEDHGPDRTTAVLAACAKALNMEDTPNAKP